MKLASPGQFPPCSAKGHGGFTLIEITMVIALIIGLIAILTISMRAYKDGSDKAGCLMIMASVQKAVRAEATLKDIYEGEPLLPSQLVGARKYFAVMPTLCQGRGTYSYMSTVPAPGTAYTRCSKATADPPHVPTNVQGW